ncbi:MAG TPA: helix-turn-helix domain-containing protein, partial [Humisphaera sp.]
PPAAAGADGELPMDEVERRHILAVLKKHDGNRAAAAADLGISVRKLYYRLGEYQRKGLMS